MWTIAVDLDETLLCVTRNPFTTPAHATCRHGHIYLRPHAFDLLKSIASIGRVGIWSSAPEEYVTQVLTESGLTDLGFEFVWSARNCSFTDYGTGTVFYYKDTDDLRRSFDTDSVLLIDDSPAKIVSHGSDAIVVDSFSGDESDDELLKVNRFIRSLQAKGREVRFDRFGWRSVSW